MKNTQTYRTEGMIRDVESKLRLMIRKYVMNAGVPHIATPIHATAVKAILIPSS